MIFKVITQLFSQPHNKKTLTSVLYMTKVWEDETTYIYSVISFVLYLITRSEQIFPIKRKSAFIRQSLPYSQRPYLKRKIILRGDLRL